MRNFRRQALHASRLELVHPATGDLVTFQAELPLDLQELLAVLAADLKAGDRR